MNQLVGFGALDPVYDPRDIRTAPITFYEMSSPSVALYRNAYPPQAAVAPQPVGSLDVATLGVATIAAIVAVAVAVNYQLGKAMAPDKASEKKWAWGNAVAGTLFPPFTLGLAVYKNYVR